MAERISNLEFIRHKKRSGTLNEKVTHRLKYVIIWSPAGGTVCGNFRDVSLEEVCHWKQALGV